MSDAAANYILAIRVRRHELLIAGDVWAHEGETVDLRILWLIGRRRRHAP